MSEEQKHFTVVSHKKLRLATVGTAVTTQVKREPMSGKELKGNLVAALSEVWDAYGKQKFLEQIKDRFDKDAIKVLKELYLPLIPKETQVEKTQEKVAIRIEIPQERSRTITVEGGASE
jgi:hypothetical protein